MYYTSYNIHRQLYMKPIMLITPAICVYEIHKKIKKYTDVIHFWKRQALMLWIIYSEKMNIYNVTANSKIAVVKCGKMLYNNMDLV